MSENEKQSTAAIVAHKPQKISAVEAVMTALTNPAVDPSKLREMLAVKREWEQDEARAAFNAAVVDFQNRCKIVAKADDAYGKKYARLDRIWRAIRPLMDECGLAVTWESVKPSGEMLLLDGHLRHTLGHSQPLHHEVPMPDLIKGQNATQRAGSAETYAKRYALCSALGIQTGDDDDDGNAGGETITDAQAHQLRKLCEKTKVPEEKLCEVYAIAKFEQLPASLFHAAKTTLEKKLPKGQQELET